MGRPHSDFVEPLILTPGGIPGNGRAPPAWGVKDGPSATPKRLRPRRRAGLGRETGISASPQPGGGRGIDGSRPIGHRAEGASN